MPDQSAIAGRLREYIGDDDGHTMSIRAFAKAMENHEPRPAGSTRAMVHRYLKEDGPEPPLAFLRVAATVLEIRPAWLITHSGERTQERQDQGRERELGIKRAVLDGLGCPPPVEDDHIPFWVHPLLEVWLRGTVPIPLDTLDRSAIDDEKKEFGVPKLAWVSGSHHEGQFKTLGEVLKAPLAAFGFDAEDMEEEARDTYIFDMARALLGLATARSRQRRKSAWKDMTTEEEESDA